MSRSTRPRRSTGGWSTGSSRRTSSTTRSRRWPGGSRASSPLTVAIGKEAFYAQVDLDERGAYDLTKAVMATNAQAGDAQEGMSAFLEKREPTWSGT